mgnify:CR=1 FL=1
MTNGVQNQAQSKGQDQNGRTFVVHIGTLTLKYETSPVPAAHILEDAGFRPPEDYILEALRGAQGPAEQQFESAQQVPLDEPHARHFRAVPRGGGRA